MVPAGRGRNGMLFGGCADVDLIAEMTAIACVSVFWVCQNELLKRGKPEIKKGEMIKVHGLLGFV
jgi:hypothetical protein